MLEERDEILEDLGRNFHYNHYGMDGAIIASSGVSDDFLDKLANALDESPFKNVAGAASKFHAGQVTCQTYYLHYALLAWTNCKSNI